MSLFESVCGSKKTEKEEFLNHIDLTTGEEVLPTTDSLEEFENKSGQRQPQDEFLEATSLDVKPHNKTEGETEGETEEEKEAA